MMIDRRVFLTGATATFVLASCGPDAPATLTVDAQSAAGMNRGPDGSDRPVTLNIIQMRGSSAFDGSDYFALQDPSAALGGELVRVDQIVLAPGSSANKIITMQPDTTVIGITAGFRDPAGKQFRVKTPAPGADAGAIIAVGPGGLKLTNV